MHRLSEKARKGITRKVRVICLCRKSVLPVLIGGLLMIEAAFVSLGAVFSGALVSASSPGNLLNFLVAAVTHTEIYVLAITALLVALIGVFFWRIFVRAWPLALSLVRIRRSA